MGGPCTIGNGEVVSDKLAEPIRSHLDIQKGSSNVKYMKKATKFYETIAQRATIEGIAIDLLCIHSQIIEHIYIYIYI